MTMLAKIKANLADLRKRHAELVAEYDDTTKVMSRDEIDDNLQERGFLETRMGRLSALKTRAMQGETVSDAEIAAALGEKPVAAPPPQKAAPVLRLPFETTTKEEQGALRARLKAEPDIMSSEQRKRFDEINEEYIEDADVYIGLRLSEFMHAVEKAGKNGENLRNRLVAYTQGRHTALNWMLASLWSDFRTAVKFNREQRIALEKRVAHLEARPAFEDAGVWVEDKVYAHGHGVTDAGSYWIAKRSTTFGEKPGASDAWRLVAKRGRDGKDARS